MDQSLLEEDGQTFKDEEEKMDVTMATQLEHLNVTAGEALESTYTCDGKTGNKQETSGTLTVENVCETQLESCIVTPGDVTSADKETREEVGNLQKCEGETGNEQTQETTKLTVESVCEMQVENPIVTTGEALEDTCDGKTENKQETSGTLTVENECETQLEGCIVTPDDVTAANKETREEEMGNLQTCEGQTGNKQAQETTKLPVESVCEMQVENPIVTQDKTTRTNTETCEEETGKVCKSAAINSAWKINYSDDSDDSESDSSSSSSSSSSSPSALVLDDDDEGFSQPAPIRTKDEVLLEELPAAEEVSVTLPEEAELLPVGTVSSILQQLVIVQSLKDTPPLNDDSVLFTADRVSVGKVFEVFGPVSSPLYILRFNSEDQIKSKGLTEGLLLYCAPSFKEYTEYILPQQLTLVRGCDASWKNDEEPPEEALDYSDDEKEQEAKRKIKNKKKTERGNTGRPVSVGQKASKQQRNKVRDFTPRPAGPRVQRQDPRNMQFPYTHSYPTPEHTNAFPMYLPPPCSYPPRAPSCPPPSFPLYPPPPFPPSFFNPAFSWPRNSVPISDFTFPPPPPPPPPPPSSSPH